MSHGIKKAGARQKSYDPPMPPKYKDHKKIEEALDHWSDSWREWLGEFAGEIKRAMLDYEQHDGERRYRDALVYLEAWGNHMHEAAWAVADQLSLAYPWEQRDKRVLTDATQPPSPPFGKGH